MSLKDLVMPGSGYAEAHVARIIAPYVRYDTAAGKVVMLPAALALRDSERVLLYLVALLGWRSVRASNSPKSSASIAGLVSALQMDAESMRDVVGDLRRRRLIVERDGRWAADPRRLGDVEAALGAAGLAAGVAETAKPASSDGVANRAPMVGLPTPIMRIRRLIEEGWFATPRTAKDVLGELRRGGAEYKATDLTRQLQLLARSGELRRRKGRPADSVREVWIYARE